MYDKKNHLGNILATITDAKIYQTNGCLAKVISGTDYYAFGAAMPSRSFQDAGYTKYRYGFNGKEKDDDFQDYGMRVYCPECGVFLSVDPIASKYPELTPYQFTSRSPIWAIDLDGLEGVVTIGFDAFAPFEFFGFGFEGDGKNRKFDANGKESFRAKAEFSVDIDKNTTNKIPVDFSKSAGLWGLGKKVVSETEVKSFSMANGMFNAHIEAGNDAVLLFFDSGATDLVNGGITINPSLSFKRDDNILSISGSVKGDAFPSNEGYLKDEHGNGIFLGAYPIHAVVAGILGGKETAPFFWLIGKGDIDMYHVDMQVRFNTDGKIDGVKGKRWSGQNTDIVDDFISPDKWNEHFTNTKPVESEKND